MKQGKLNSSGSRSASQRVTDEVEALLEPLVKAGCCRERLLNYLLATKIAYEVYDTDRSGSGLFPRFTFDDYFGFDRKSLKTVLKRMRQCAKDVDVLSRKLGSGWVLKAFQMNLSPGQREAHTEHFGGNNPAPGFVVPSIPHSLGILANAVEEESKQATFRERRIYDEALEALLRCVRETTGQWYYEKAAALLRVAVTHRDTPDGTTLRVWARSRPALRSLHKS